MRAPTQKNTCWFSRLSNHANSSIWLWTTLWVLENLRVPSTEVSRYIWKQSRIVFGTLQPDHWPEIWTSLGVRSSRKNKKTCNAAKSLGVVKKLWHLWIDVRSEFKLLVFNDGTDVCMSSAARMLAKAWDDKFHRLCVFFNGYLLVETLHVGVESINNGGIVLRVVPDRKVDFWNGKSLAKLNFEVIQNTSSTMFLVP